MVCDGPENELRETSKMRHFDRLTRTPKSNTWWQLLLFGILNWKQVEQIYEWLEKYHFWTTHFSTQEEKETFDQKTWNPMTSCCSLQIFFEKALKPTSQTLHAFEVNRHGSWIWLWELGNRKCLQIHTPNIKNSGFAGQNVTFRHSSNVPRKF